MSEENKSEETKAEAPVAEEDKETKDPAAGSTSSQQASSGQEKKDVAVPAKFKDLVTEIEKMSVLDLSELVKVLEDKFGVSAAPAPVAVAGAVAEEKSSFDVELTGIGDSKIGVIKAVREITQKGLKDAKDMVEAAPVVVKEGVKKEEAEEIKKKIEEAGGSVTLK